MDFSFSMLLHFYGLDWLSVVLGLYGTYLLGDQRRTGFLFIIVSLFCASTVAVLAQTYAFLAANIPAIFLNLRAWLKWRAEEVASSELSKP